MQAWILLDPWILEDLWSLEDPRCQILPHAQKVLICFARESVVQHPLAASAGSPWQSISTPFERVAGFGT